MFCVTSSEELLHKWEECHLSVRLRSVRCACTSMCGCKKWDLCIRVWKRSFWVAKFRLKKIRYTHWLSRGICFVASCVSSVTLTLFCGSCDMTSRIWPWLDFFMEQLTEGANPSHLIYTRKPSCTQACLCHSKCGLPSSCKIKNAYMS